MTSITARDVADYFLASVDSESGDNLSNLKLQKLVYYAQGFHLGMRGEPMFGDPIEAWDHGPVVRTLYFSFRHRGNQAILPPEHFAAEDYLPEHREILDAVLKAYGQFSAWKLRDITHDEPPWAETPRDGVIAPDLMRGFFSRMVEAGRTGQTLPGEPPWPTNSFNYQRRTEIMKRAPGRERIREALRRSAPDAVGNATQD